MIKRLILILALCLMLVGCKSVQYVPIETIDSTSVDVREITIIELDTIYYEIPSQTAERVTKDTTSRLETDFAISYAKILDDGSLFHSLKNKPQSIPKEVEKKSTRKDSTFTRWEIKEVPIEVEKELSWWQKLKQDVGGIAIGFLIVLLLSVIAYFVFKKK